MEREHKEPGLLERVQGFALKGEVASIEPYGGGIINSTYVVTGEQGERYILQRINQTVFRKPREVMENIEAVTGHLQKKIRLRGGDPGRETLLLLPARDGKSYVSPSKEEVWRMYAFIEGTICYDQILREEDFESCAWAFGRFQRDLLDFPAISLHETIPHFHDTPVYLERFHRALQEDPAGRREKATECIRFLMEHADLAGRLMEPLSRGELPLRVTHNDTKISNLLYDAATGEPLCVIDLDTVMPGLVAFDFGDAIRSGAVSAREDEEDLSKVHFIPSRYEAFYRGYLRGCEGCLTEAEIRLLPIGALVITYEQALRFLTDYLLGDVYYKVGRPDHNLIRARTQIRVLEQMLEDLPGRCLA